MPEVVTDFQRNRVRIEDKLRRKRILGFLEANGMLEHIRALEAVLERLTMQVEVAGLMLRFAAPASPERTAAIRKHFQWRRLKEASR